MDLRTFEYLYFRLNGHSVEDIHQETGIDIQEIGLMDKALHSVFQEIEAERPKAENIGEDFARLSRYVYGVKSDLKRGLASPDTIKARSGELFALPAVANLDFKQISLQDAIVQRRSLRKYSEQKLSMEELSFLLYCCSMVKDFKTRKNIKTTTRNVPSAGSRHPIETFVDVRRVAGLKQGLYYYHPVKHGLLLFDDSPETQNKIIEGCFNQKAVQGSAVNFIYTAVPYRTSWRYGQRGYRYLYLDAGHIAQNLHLAAEAIAGGACMIGGYLDEAMNEILRIDGIEEFVIYIASVGKK